MYKKQCFIILVLIFPIVYPAFCSAFEKQDIVIYELFLKHFFKINEVRYEFPKYDQILISETTYLDDSLISRDDEAKKYIQVFFPAISEQMITKLIDINKKPEKFVKSYFKTIVPEVIPEKTEKSLFNGKSLEISWSNFYDNYGKFKGILRLSRISYTKNGRALMSYGFACGSKCGGGGIVLMEKESNIWKVMLVFPLWIS